ncbi:hypothetical protein OROHE_019721 [Orobanche hederae]
MAAATTGWGNKRQRRLVEEISAAEVIPGVMQGLAKSIAWGGEGATCLIERGFGKSTPHACLEENTTWDLIDDIEKLRNHLKIPEWL